MNEPRKIELLTPAKNTEYGIEVILHGADAVYIGAPMFGARASAGNTVSDIERLSEFAHRYHARVYTAIASNWYVRRSRRRFWKNKDDADKAQAYQTLFVF